MKQVWLFDAQLDECPQEVEDEVKRMWMEFELGNDFYFRTVKIGDADDEHDYPVLMKWLTSEGRSNGEIVVIHWWW